MQFKERGLDFCCTKLFNAINKAIARLQKINHVTDTYPRHCAFSICKITWQLSEILAFSKVTFETIKPVQPERFQNDYLCQLKNWNLNTSLYEKFFPMFECLLRYRYRHMPGQREYWAFLGLKK